MTSPNPNLAFRERTIGDFTIPTLARGDAKRPSLTLSVSGKIINSVVDKQRQQQQQDWKVEIATAVKAERGGDAWNSDANFTISVGFRFNVNSGWHGYAKGGAPQKLDVENFLKPVVDALAAGLFCDNETDPRDISVWDYDDSNFNTLLIHRLPDAPRRDGEGVAICVSASG